MSFPTMSTRLGASFLISHYSEMPPLTSQEVVAYAEGNGSMTHNVTTLTDQDEGGARDKSDVPKMMWMFIAPVIFLVGLCGNVLVIMVMSRKRMQGTTTCVYLRSMAVADIGVIITGIIPEWLDFMEIIVFKDIHPATCKLEKFVFYSFGDISIWILVIFTVDRFIAVCYPLHTKNICVASRAPWFVLGAVLLAVAKNICVFWTRGGIYEVQQQWKLIDGSNASAPVNVTVRVDNCGRPYRHFELFIRPWIAFTLVSLIPFLVILFCNTFIIRALIKVRRMRSQQTTFSSRDKTLLQMTAMCLAASFCFLICITPSIILLIGKPYWKLSRGNYNYAYDLAKTVNNLLMFVNHSINFFLYCMTGKRFRTELVNMIRRQSRSGSRDGDSSATESRTSYYRVSALRPISRKVNAKNGLVKYSKVENRLHNRESSL